MRGPLAAALAALCVMGCNARAQTAGAIAVVSTATPFNRSDAADTRRGDFSFAGGVHLTSPDTTQLGGLSDMAVGADGAVTAISDEGQRLDARLVLGADGRLEALSDARLQPLRGPDGQPVQGKQQGDAEGIVIWPNGDVMVSFERDHRIWIYAGDGSPPRPAPSPVVGMPANSGMEALALAPSRGPDAYWVGIEGGAIWLCRLGGGCEQDLAQPRPPMAYRLTALAETAEGALVILHRAWDPFRGFRAIVSINDRDPDGRARLLGRLVITPPLTVDNYEGLAVLPAANGAVRLYLLSDDNFSARERTLLMAFEWTPSKAPAKAADLPTSP